MTGVFAPDHRERNEIRDRRAKRTNLNLLELTTSEVHYDSSVTVSSRLFGSTHHAQAIPDTRKQGEERMEVLGSAC